MSESDGTVMIEGAKILYRNFEGKKMEFNKEGDRNFCVILDPDIAGVLAADGWNVKVKAPKDAEDDDPPLVFLPVKINFDSFRPPRIVLVTSRGRTNLDESSLSMLDWADILNVDLIIRPYHWTRANPRSAGITAYLQSLFVTIEEDPLEVKYSELPIQ